MNKKAQLARFPVLIGSIGTIIIMVFLFLLLAGLFNSPKINTIQSTNKYISKSGALVVFLKMPVNGRIVADLIAENDFIEFKNYLRKYLGTDRCFLTIDKKIANTGCIVVGTPDAKIDALLPLYNGSAVNVHLEVEW